MKNIIKNNFIILSACLLMVGCASKKDNIIFDKDNGGLYLPDGFAKVSTYDQTLSLCKDGKNVDEITKLRNVTKGTIIGHLETLFMRGDLGIDVIKKIIPKELVPQIPKISEAFIELKTEILTPVFEKLGSKVPFEDLRLVRLYMMAERVKIGKKE